MEQNRNMEFMAIAMKYFPEAKAKMDESGIELPLEVLPHFMDLFQKVMQEAYELGRQDAKE
ncbi:ComZ family protein [Peribacillus deserti]|uniref:Competence protein ComG n=1 Tax=Peribacillus deserti TaxID=673318 RepID=A0A2N5M7N1_9BACI|nr:ComZ family protein [Peribacillus deserti]PLT30388.1 competence protein ComG [Peribacillus deserti]